MVLGEGDAAIGMLMKEHFLSQMSPASGARTFPLVFPCVLSGWMLGLHAQQGQQLPLKGNHTSPDFSPDEIISRKRKYCQEMRATKRGAGRMAYWDHVGKVESWCC